MRRPLTRVLVAGFALAGAALVGGCASPPSLVEPAEIASSVIVRGRVTGLDAATLSGDAVLVVELRDDERQGVVAEQRLPLAGRTDPVAFELRADARGPTAGAPHTLRAAVLAGGQPRAVSTPHRLTLLAGVVDVGPWPLAPYVSPGGFASTWQCGGRAVMIGFIGQALRLTDGERHFDLQRVPSASGTRFERPGDPGTFAWLHDSRATVSVGGQVYPECVPTARPRDAR